MSLLRYLGSFFAGHEYCENSEAAPSSFYRRDQSPSTSSPSISSGPSLKLWTNSSSSLKPLEIRSTEGLNKSLKHVHSDIICNIPVSVLDKDSPQGKEAHQKISGNIQHQRTSEQFKRHGSGRYPATAAYVLIPSKSVLAKTSKNRLTQRARLRTRTVLIEECTKAAKEPRSIVDSGLRRSARPRKPRQLFNGEVLEDWRKQSRKPKHFDPTYKYSSPTLDASPAPSPSLPKPRKPQGDPTYRPSSSPTPSPSAPAVSKKKKSRRPKKDSSSSPKGEALK